MAKAIILRGIEPSVREFADFFVSDINASSIDENGIKLLNVSYHVM